MIGTEENPLQKWGEKLEQKVKVLEQQIQDLEEIITILIQKLNKG